ncbi:hypothetical protein ACIBEA_06890 [Streptomyces sp. NPDC051555]|uniref:hypothetical protein n=1 Tax=Streptomyces sp. NPDC051555 TaxID=3365657 RepID=UPI0037B8AAD5
MNRKHLVLPTALIVCGAAIAFTLWSGGEEPEPPQRLCFGTLDERTAGLIDDGQGGRVGFGEFERKGQGDHAFFRSCIAQRTNPDGDTTRTTIYSLTMQDSKSGTGLPGGAVPLGGGLAGWALPDKAEAQLPAGCAGRLGSTAPYIVVSLSAPFQEEKKGIVDRDTAIRNSATVVSESATNLARLSGCS